MVWESWYWKVRLKKIASEIELLAAQPDASDLDISNLEISIFTGFFLVRKLREAQTKLSPQTSNQSIKCLTAPKLDDAPGVDLMNRFDIDLLYELDKLTKGNMSLQQACNLFIHSVFLWMVYEGESEHDIAVAAVDLTSSHDKEKFVYRFSIDEILRVFLSVANDENDILSIHRNPETNNWIVRH